MVICFFNFTLSVKSCIIVFLWLISLDIILFRLFWMARFLSWLNVFHQCFCFLPDKYPGVGYWMLVPLIFWDSSRVPFFHILTDTCYLLSLIIAVLTDVRMFSVVLLCVSLMISVLNMFSFSLLTVSSLEKISVEILCTCLSQVVCFRYWIVWALFKFWVLHPVSDTWFRNISYSLGNIFIY